MAKSKRSIRRVIIFELLKHLKSDYDVELTPDVVRSLIYSRSGIEALLSFRSDSRLDDLQGALVRLESGLYGVCIACKQPIARAHLDSDVTRRVCPSCEAEFNHRAVMADAPASPSRGI